jgi:hypothetical protein
MAAGCWLLCSGMQIIGLSREKGDDGAALSGLSAAAGKLGPDVVFCGT